MIITKKDIEESLFVKKYGEACANLVYCLFEGQQYKMCATCAISEFVENFKSGSPGLYALMRRLTDAEAIIRETMVKDILGSTEEIMEARKKLFLLVDLAPVLLLGLYPLFLANGREFPVLHREEINKERELFREADQGDFNKLAEKMKALNAEWFNRLIANAARMSNSVANTKIILWLIKIFVEKVGDGNKEENGEMFAVIEKFLAANNRQEV